jgi:hypothetical protein
MIKIKYEEKNIEILYFVPVGMVEGGCLDLSRLGLDDSKLPQNKQYS